MKSVYFDIVLALTSMSPIPAGWTLERN